MEIDLVSAIFIGCVVCLSVASVGLAIAAIIVAINDCKERKK